MVTNATCSNEGLLTGCYVIQRVNSEINACSDSWKHKLMPQEIRGVDSHPCFLMRSNKASSSGIISVVRRYGIPSQLIQRLHLKRIKLVTQRGCLHASSGHGKTHALLRSLQALLACTSSLGCFVEAVLMQRGGVCVFTLGGEGGVRTKADTTLIISIPNARLTSRRWACIITSDGTPSFSA